MLALPRLELGDDPAAEHHQDAVGQRHDLVELGRDDQHADALVARLDDALVDVFDRADVEAARRLRGDHQLDVARQLAADDQLLLVAARKVVGEAEDRWRADVEVDDDLGARLVDRPASAW